MLIILSIHNFAIFNIFLCKLLLILLIFFKKTLKSTARIVNVYYSIRKVWEAKFTNITYNTSNNFLHKLQEYGVFTKNFPYVINLILIVILKCLT